MLQYNEYFNYSTLDDTIVHVEVWGFFSGFQGFEFKASGCRFGV